MWIVKFSPTFAPKYQRMNLLVRLIPGTLCLCFLVALRAQTVPVGELRPYLDSLSVAQKVELLDYMRQLGVSIDREVAFGYQELDKTKEARALQYIRLNLLGQAPSNDDRTTVRFKRDTLHFGQVWEGEIMLDSFLLTNTGSRPYIVRDVKATCDCTVLRRPERPIMPGETAAIRVEFDTKGKIGISTPGIVIYDNTKPNGRQIVYMQADIIPRNKPKNALGN